MLIAAWSLSFNFNTAFTFQSAVLLKTFTLKVLIKQTINLYSSSLFKKQLSSQKNKSLYKISFKIEKSLFKS